MVKVTPMMQQFQAAKDEHPEAIIFFRMGDFYEMFADDAIVASEALDITLTSRSAGELGRVPMCGVPHHAAESYIAKLIDQGFRVAICEQVEDPKTATGLVKRDIIRIISPGTVLESTMLPESAHSFLATLYTQKESWGLCYTDISTGEFKATEFILNKGEDTHKIFDEIYRIKPKEILIPEKLYENSEFRKRLKQVFEGLVTKADNEDFNLKNAKAVLAAHFQIEDAETLFLPELAMVAAGATMAFLNRTQKRNLDYIAKIEHYNSNTYMILDQSTRKNLEITETIFTAKKKGSLLWVIDKTVGVMGRRLIGDWLNNPLLDIATILQRQAAVKELYDNPILVDELKDFLLEIHDLERLAGRIAYGSGTPRDVASLKSSMVNLKNFKAILFQLSAQLFVDMAKEFDDLNDIYLNIENTLQDEPPISPKEGNLIKEGFNSEIDELKNIAKNGKQMILEIEAAEREKTGIKTLKIRYNRVFGYYIEVSNSYKDQVPDYYVRKQTLTNGERYFTTELKEYENKVLGATDKLYQMEYDEFCQLREYITANTPRIQLTASIIAITDVIRSLAVVARENNYCCPTLDNSGKIEIINGRHPMVEKVNEEIFIANDVFLDNETNRIMVITGPNMAGKSTYMRQAALIILLAQIGSFVPAESAHIGLVDRIFTRIGASDDLVGGNSTFMVEMRETAEILKHSTEKSFVLLDEIGRGTSTFDGLALAWACIEFLADATYAPKTMFATHYHELTQLEDEKSNIKNYAITVEEINNDLTFLRKIIPGKADKSYGIQVAKLAGLPISIINQAKKKLKILEKNKLNIIKHPEEKIDFSLFKELTDEQEEVLNQIQDLDLNNLKPIKALSLLAEWQDYLGEKHE
ncbi:MAG: DNA mismatch repair protein MutS [Clostridiales bacterium]